MGRIDILKKPGNIFNGDEIGMQLCPEIGRLLGEKGEKDFYTISSGKENETITVLCTFSAAGDALPPMIMFPYKIIPAHLLESVPDDWPIEQDEIEKKRKKEARELKKKERERQNEEKKAENERKRQLKQEEFKMKKSKPTKRKKSL
ncbi:hypothetical protein EVAR_76105_1 [Eumeta japonica]|uniref:Uncharacterized protein n=1 Tax=Eumeta variegata TaxID=151549 RepID=A0A4C1W6T1_EUMVA|nr:hypothetical protein EVAR_76105_1 [Eumeta japonica]